MEIRRSAFIRLWEQESLWKSRVHRAGLGAWAIITFRSPMRNVSAMARRLKMVGFCLIPVLLNWYFYRWGPRGSMTIEYGPIVSVLAISIMLTIWLLFSVWRKQRAARQLGLSIQKFRWIKDCAPAVCFIPLLFRFELHSTWADPTGAVWKQVVYYGHTHLSLLLFAFAVACLISFQVRAKLIFALNTET